MCVPWGIRCLCYKFCQNFGALTWQMLKFNWNGNFVYLWLLCYVWVRTCELYYVHIFLCLCVCEYVCVVYMLVCLPQCVCVCEFVVFGPPHVFSFFLNSVVISRWKWCVNTTVSVLVSLPASLLYLSLTFNLSLLLSVSHIETQVVAGEALGSYGPYA